MLVILYLIFINFIILFVFGRYIGKNGMFLMTLISFISSLFYSAYLALLVFYYQIVTTCKLWTVCFGFIGNVNFNIVNDELSITMFLVVLIISGLVHCYSFSYMNGDPYIITFFSFLSLFTFFMLLLVSSNNLIQLFFGWEGIGLCSYLLVGFWSTRLQANRSALKAVVVNRIGDVFFMLGIGYTYSYLFSFDFAVLYTSAEFIQDVYLTIFLFKIPVLDVICLFFILAAIAKSAQLGLHTWLPDAMEGPTPVSALIHAATMVTAGIFLLNRLSFILVYAVNMQKFIIIIGALTILFAASSALVQNDIKKIIAYSTCSQLGYMFLACGLLAFNVSFFHLVTHAVFKALLFLGAGSVIHSLLGEQDIRRMGSLGKFLPVTYAAMSVGSLALIGLPFLSGFYSKETILWASISNSWFYIFALICSLVGALLTSIYSFRLLYIVFFGNLNTFRVSVKFVSESDFYILIPLFILSFLSIFLGYSGYDFFVGFGSNFFSNALSIQVLNYYFIPYRSLFFFFFLFSLIFFYIFFYNIKFDSADILRQLVNNTTFKFLSSKWYFDYLYNYLLSMGGTFSYYWFLVVDRATDIASGFFLLNSIYKIRLVLQKYTNFHQLYMNSYIAFTLLIIFFIIFIYS